jgi:hypothetical protein
MYDAGFPTLINCTLARNQAGADGGALASEGQAGGKGYCGYTAHAHLVNSIVHENSEPQIYDAVAWTTATYSNLSGGLPGVGNIETDPMFTDPDNGDFRLLAGSPCIDAGINAAISDIAHADLADNPRFADDPATADSGCGVPVIVDMGAYEFQGLPAEVVFGDVDGNGWVGVHDLITVTACMNSDDPACRVADLDLDGEVGLSDLQLVRGRLALSGPQVP